MADKDSRPQSKTKSITVTTMLYYEPLHMLLYAHTII